MLELEWVMSNVLCGFVIPALARSTGRGGTITPNVLLGPASLCEPPNKAKGFERKGFARAPGFGTNREVDGGVKDVSCSGGGGGAATSFVPLLQLPSQEDGVSHSFTRFTRPWVNCTKINMMEPHIRVGKKQQIHHGRATRHTFKTTYSLKYKVLYICLQALILFMHALSSCLFGCSPRFPVVRLGRSRALMAPYLVAGGHDHCLVRRTQSMEYRHTTYTVRLLCRLYGTANEARLGIKFPWTPLDERCDVTRSKPNRNGTRL